MTANGDERDSSSNSSVQKTNEPEGVLARIWDALNHQVLGGIVVVVIVAVAGLVWAMIRDSGGVDEGPIRFTGLQAGSEISQILQPLCVSGSTPQDGTRWWAMAKTPAGLFPAQQAFEADGDRYLTTELHVGSLDESGEGFGVIVYEVSSADESIERITESWRLTSQNQPTPWMPGPNDIELLAVDVVRKASSEHQFAC